MPRLKKVMPVIRTVADIDAGFIEVAKAYRAELATKKAEHDRVLKLLNVVSHDIHVLSARVAAVDEAVSNKVFNANL